MGPRGGGRRPVVTVAAVAVVSTTAVTMVVVMVVGMVVPGIGPGIPGIRAVVHDGSVVVAVRGDGARRVEGGSSREVAAILAVKGIPAGYCWLIVIKSAKQVKMSLAWKASPGGLMLE